ncbi:MAG: hypothetical protein AB2385_07275 [Symbiobacterium sp.]|uniref:hypothetical protein n=1 Tax=Symbiobacterium sp. TaxID=1971213 RepID=UPI003463CAC1
MVRLTRCRLRWFFPLLALAICLPTAVAWANAGPPRFSGNTGGPLLPGKSDQVHVLGEILRFDLAPDFSRATVTARYTLANRGPALDDQPFIFVVQEGRETAALTASWQGEPLAVEAVDLAQFTPEERAEMAGAWGTVDVWMDPVTGEPYTPGAFVGTDPVVSYYRFTVDLPAGATGELTVRYEQPSAWDRTRYALRVHHYQYLVLPARGWASFGPLEVRVAAPEGSRYYFAANLDFRREDGEYVAEYPGLPQANLSFAVMDRSGLFLGPHPGPYYWLGFAVVLALAVAIGAGIGRAAGRLPGRGWALGVGTVGGLLLGGALDLWLAVNLLMALPALREQSYGPAFVGIGQGLVAAVVSAGVANRVAVRTWRRRHGGSVA